MIYRLAKPNDAESLALIYLSCSDDLIASFMCRLGKRWLISYHRVVLNEPHFVAVCAENEQGRVVGYVSGTLDNAAQLGWLRQHRLALAISAIPGLLRRPTLLPGVLARQKGAGKSAHNGFVVTAGARIEFFGVYKEARIGGEAIALLLTWLAVMRELGSGPIRLEVDTANSRSAELHGAMGAKVLETFTTLDKKERQIMEYPAN
jgi:hypothetical protein